MRISDWSSDVCSSDLDPYLQGLDNDLRELLLSWFDTGFLDLRAIDWNSPASLLEKLVAYEAVHEITSWEDLRNRLDSDRRCYALFHPRMPDEPLAFVRSEERGVGQACVSTCRSWWSPYNSKKTKQEN